MKKLTYLTVALLLVAFSLPASAQHRIGIIGGLNFADAVIEGNRQAFEVSSRTLFGVGGVVDLSLGKTFSLHLVPMYLQKGGISTDIQRNIEFRLKSSYLEMPLFLKAEFGNTIRPYLMAGPSLGILLTSDLEAKFQGVVFKGDNKEATESVDIAAAFGAGLRYPMGRTSVFLEGRYFLGLRDNIKGGTFELKAGSLSDEVTWNKDTDKLENRGFQIMAGVTFAL